MTGSDPNPDPGSGPRSGHRSGQRSGRLRDAIRGKWGDLRERLMSGAVLAVVGLILLFSSGIWLRLGVSAVVGVMIWELARLTGQHQANLINVSIRHAKADPGSLFAAVELAITMAKARGRA